MSAPGTPELPPHATPAADAPADGRGPSAPYGPQTPAVRRFLQRLAALSLADWDRAAAAYAAAARQAAAVAADRDLQRAVERAGRGAERDAILGPLAQLVRVDERGEAAEADAPLDLHPVAEAALAVLLALVVRDVLSPRAFATLYAPFAATIPVAALEG